MNHDIKNLAYLAGLFDGEGTVNITRKHVKGGQLAIKIAVYNTDPEILDGFLFFGGSIYHKMDKRPVNKPFLGMWQCYKAGIPNFCRVMLEYNREKEKRQKMSLILEYEPWLFRDVNDPNRFGKLSEEATAKRLEFGIRFDETVLAARQDNRDRRIQK